jgi:hypothetical protein
MQWPDVRGLVGQAFRRRSPSRRSRGGVEVIDARRLADAERLAGAVPAGCSWLDDRTVENLDLQLVFRAIDRSSTVEGAQALWRWLVAPAHDLGVVAARERRLARLTDPAVRNRICDLLRGAHGAEAGHLPRLLWEAPPARPPTAWLVGLLAALVTVSVLAVKWPLLAIVSCVLFTANVVLDDWANLRLAHQARALEVLGRVLGSAARLVEHRVLGADLHAELAAELAPLTALRKRIAILAVTDPFELANLLRAGLLVRLLALARCTTIIELERARIRRIVCWLGELDAAISVATLRAERADCCVPVLSVAAPGLIARSLIHPALADAIGNDVTLAASGRGLIVTGSNMSGKSTLLRAIAVNAVCAQSIHTTFGQWESSLLRVFCVMRVADDPEHGLSTFAVEVAAVGTLLAAVARPGPALLVLDEPFSGTNPAIRVPIVVSVLEHLARDHVVIAATHDLDVAAQLAPQFQRGYFCEVDPLADPGDQLTGAFDRKLHPGIAPSTNAVAVLARAGYPAVLVRAIEQRSRSQLSVVIEN